MEPPVKALEATVGLSPSSALVGWELSSLFSLFGASGEVLVDVPVATG